MNSGVSPKAISATHSNNMPKIKSIKAREILDSRGNPTVQVQVTLDSGIAARAAVPSGASTGLHEAWELRDGGKRYKGKGVLKAVRNVNGPIARKLKGMEVSRQRAIDKLMLELDGTENKQRLGANAILGVSLACAQAGASARKIGLYKYLRQVFNLKLKGYRLPQAMMNIYNGGVHANNGLSVQEFMVIPQAGRFSERVRIGAEVFQTLKSIMSARGLLTLVGDEGGFAARLKNNEEALKLIVLAIKKAGYQPGTSDLAKTAAGKKIYLALDIAASEFFKLDKYFFENKKPWLAGRMIELMEDWVKKYPIISIEDGLAEDDWPNWQLLTEKLGKKIMLVGDDLFVTNIERLGQGIQWGVANAILIKLNQIGTVSETIDTINLARRHHYKVIVSHRSGETTDTSIADLAVAVNADYIKTGSLSRGERVAKYNRLMEIEDEL